jgi:predicted transcriptional regulator
MELQSNNSYYKNTNNHQLKTPFKSSISSESEVIISLSNKVMNNQKLTDSERILLTSIIGKSSFVKTVKLMTDNKSKEVEKINKNLSKITSDFQKNSEKAKEIFKDQKQLDSKVFRQSAAALLLSYDERLKYSHFHTEVSKIIERGEIVKENELTKILDQHNKVSPKQPQNAGLLVFEVDKIQIFYDRSGKLIIGPSRRVQVDPIELDKSNVKVEKIKIDNTINIYKKIANNRPYNNAAPMLEFMSFFREMRQINPQLTLNEAFRAFQPSGKDMFDKYLSGDCVIISDKFKSEMDSIGLKVAVVGQYTGASWARPPIPGCNEIWNQYDIQTENIHHTALALRYSDENGNEKGYFFDPGTEVPDQYKNSNSWTSFLKDNFGKYDTPASINDVGHVSKMQFSGKTKTVIKGKENTKQILGFDLLSGNLYISSDGIKGLQGLPTNAQGRVSIDLAALKNPNQMGDYFINGQPQKLTHLEALKLIHKIAGDRFQLPPDFTDNVLTLANVMDELFSQVLLHPAETVKRFYSEVQNAANQAKFVEDRLTEAKKIPKEAMSETKKNLLNDLDNGDKKIRQKKADMENAIMNKDTDSILRLSKEIKKIHDDVINIYKQLSGDAIDFDEIEIPA